MMMLCGFGANGYPEIYWDVCRDVPDPDGWFETVWSDYRTNKIYDEGAKV
jgi:hypothetical protein